MKIFLTSMLLICFGFNTPAKKSNGITLDDKYKVETTFSGNFKNESSFHLIVANNKDTKNFEIIPYIYQQESFKKLKSVVFASEPSVVSFHSNDGVISLITSLKKGKDEVFSIYDINAQTGETQKSKDISTKDFKAVSRNPNNNLLIFADKAQIKILDVANSQAMKTIIAKPTDVNSDLIKEVSKNHIEVVNTHEFVANGSIGDYKLFHDDNHVYIVSEDSKSGATSVSMIPLNEGEKTAVTTKAFLNDNQDAKSMSSYIDNGKLYKLEIGKDNAGINIFDIDGDALQKNIKISEDQIATKANGFESLDAFIKQANRSANQSTITVNHAKNNSLVMRLDYVKKSDYSYRNDWWWYHQMFMMNQMMWQQQQMMNNVPRFGPSADEMFDNTLLNTEESHYFEIVLNLNQEIMSSNASELVFRDIDKKAYIKVLDDNKKLKNASSVFTSTSFRYFAYDKESNSYMIFETPFDDQL